MHATSPAHVKSAAEEPAPSTLRQVDKGRHYSVAPCVGNDVHAKPYVPLRPSQKMLLPADLGACEELPAKHSSGTCREASAPRPERKPCLQAKQPAGHSPVSLSMPSKHLDQSIPVSADCSPLPLAPVLNSNISLPRGPARAIPNVSGHNTAAAAPTTSHWHLEAGQNTPEQPNAAYMNSKPGQHPWLSPHHVCKPASPLLDAQPRPLRASQPSASALCAGTFSEGCITPDGNDEPLIGVAGSVRPRSWTPEHSQYQPSILSNISAVQHSAWSQPPLPAPHAATSNTADDKMDLRAHITSALLRLPLEYLSRMLGWRVSAVSAPEQHHGMQYQYHGASQVALPSASAGIPPEVTALPIDSMQPRNASASGLSMPLGKGLPEQLPLVQVCVLSADGPAQDELHSRQSPAASAVPIDVHLAANPAGQGHAVLHKAPPMDTASESVRLAQQDSCHALPALQMIPGKPTSQLSPASKAASKAARKRRRSYYLKPADHPMSMDVEDCGSGKPALTGISPELTNDDTSKIECHCKNGSPSAFDPPSDAAVASTTSSGQLATHQQQVIVTTTAPGSLPSACTTVPLPFVSPESQPAHQPLHASKAAGENSTTPILAFQATPDSTQHLGNVMDDDICIPHDCKIPYQAVITPLASTMPVEATSLQSNSQEEHCLFCISGADQKQLLVPAAAQQQRSRLAAPGMSAATQGDGHTLKVTAARDGFSSPQCDATQMLTHQPSKSLKHDPAALVDSQQNKATPMFAGKVEQVCGCERTCHTQSSCLSHDRGVSLPESQTASHGQCQHTSASSHSASYDVSFAEHQTKLLQGDCHFHKQQQSCQQSPENIATGVFAGLPKQGSPLTDPLWPLKQHSCGRSSKKMPAITALYDPPGDSEQDKLGRQIKAQTADEAKPFRRAKRLTGLEVLFQHHQVNSIEEICNIARRQVSELCAAARLPEA